MSKVSHAQAKVTDKQGKAVGEIPSLDFLLKWYGSHAPGTRSGDGEGKWEGSLIHGDFKCDNMVSRDTYSSFLCPCIMLTREPQIFHPTEPRVIGILDWELSTLG